MWGVLFLFLTLAFRCGAVETQDQLLKAVLMDGYNPGALPNNGSTPIKLSYRIYGIQEVNTLDSTITIKAELDMEWKDSRLVWDPNDYDGLSQSTFFTNPETNMDYIWTPEIVATGNTQKSMWESMDRVMALVRSDGSVYYWSNGALNIKASLDLTMFPYDKQRFNVTFTTWTHPVDMLTLEIDETAPVYKSEMYYQQNIQWEIVDMDYFYGSIDIDSYGTFSEATFMLDIQRKGNTLLITVMVPGVFVCFMGLLYYFMPRGNGERVPYLSTVILTEIMFLVILSQFVPLANKVPLIEYLFLGLSVVLCILAVPVTILDYRYLKLKDAKSKTSKVKKKIKKKEQYLKL